MSDVIRVVVLNPETQERSLACLERPLVWESVLKELLESQGVAVNMNDLSNYAIMLHPSGQAVDSGISVLKSNLNRAIRDNDVVSVEQKANKSTTNSINNSQVLFDALTSNDLNTQKSNAQSRGGKNKRGRSLSSKFWLINKLAANGRITAEEKNVLKGLLINGNEDFDRALARCETTGDTGELMKLSSKLPKSDIIMNSSNLDSQLARDLEADLGLDENFQFNSGFDFGFPPIDNGLLGSNTNQAPVSVSLEVEALLNSPKGSYDFYNSPFGDTLTKNTNDNELKLF